MLLLLLRLFKSVALWNRFYSYDLHSNLIYRERKIERERIDNNMHHALAQ